MAIFNPGPITGQISGRVGGTVFSHNRGGAYIRNGAMPVASQSTAALKIKASTAAMVQAWSGLTAAQRLQWDTYAKEHTTVNRLGRTITITGQNWFVALNSRLLYSDESAVFVPPTTAAPVARVLSAFTVDVGSGDTQVVFSDSPLAANERLWIRAAKTSTGAVTNFKNKLSTALITAAAATSPVDLSTALPALLGTLQEDAWYHIEGRILDTDNGLISAPWFASAQCLNTP